MARHVDPDDTSFRRSLLRAAAGGLAALVITFAITAALMRLGGDDGTGGPAVVLTGSPTPAPTVAEAVETPSPTPGSAPSPSPSPSATPTPVPTEVTEATVSGVTVQILEQVGYEAQAAAAADVLRRLGYTVIAVNVTDRQVDETTVLASPGHAGDAEQLRDLDERFAVVAENDGFAEEVNLHVIVGPEFTET